MLRSNQPNILCLFLFLLLGTSCKIRRQHTATVYAEKQELKELKVSRDLKKEVSVWLGTPYRYGGNSRQGVDCSGFVDAVYWTVYEIRLPRTAKDIYRVCKPVKINDLREGDLVFFNYTGKGVSHVGIYLGAGKYVHASTTKGVVISDLKNEYTRKNFVGCGRIR